MAIVRAVYSMLILEFSALVPRVRSRSHSSNTLLDLLHWFFLKWWQYLYPILFSPGKILKITSFFVKPYQFYIFITHENVLNLQYKNVL